MSYPSSVTPFMRRLMAHSTNTFKIEPSGARSSLGAGQVISFQLPSNSLVDLKSIKWMFNAQVSGGTRPRLPNKISSLIERYTVEAGGIVVYQGSLGYNVVKHAKDALELALCDETTKNIQNHEFIPRLVDSDGRDVSGGAEAPPSAGDRTQFCVDDWLGFMEAKPEIIDTSLLPELTLKIYLAPNSVCTDSAGTATPGTGGSGFDLVGAGGASYTINNQRLLVTTYSINDGTFDLLMDGRIKEDRFIEIPFKQYFTFFDGSHSGSTRFSIGTQSLDKVYAVWRPQAYSTQAAPVVVSGFEYASNVQENSSHSGEKYVSKYFNFPIPTGLTGAQFQLNGTLYPQFLATPDEWYQISKDCSKKESLEVKSLQAWRENYHVYAVRLNHPAADDLRLISGLDTRSMNMAGYFTSQGVTGTPPVTIICEVTSTLRIAEGMAVSVVV